MAGEMGPREGLDEERALRSCAAMTPTSACEAADEDGGLGRAGDGGGALEGSDAVEASEEASGDGLCSRAGRASGRV